MEISFPILFEDFYLKNIGPITTGSEISRSLASTLVFYIKQIQQLKDEITTLEGKKKDILQVVPKNMLKRKDDIENKIMATTEEISRVRAEKDNVKKLLEQTSGKLKKLEQMKFQVEQGAANSADYRKLKNEAVNQDKELKKQLKRIDFYLESLFNMKNSGVEESNKISFHLKKESSTLNEKELLENEISSKQNQIKDFNLKIQEIQNKQTLEPKSFESFVVFFHNQFEEILKTYHNPLLPKFRLDSVISDIRLRFDEFFEGKVVDFSDNEAKQLFSDCLVQIATKYVSTQK